jgi:hypothetical protein
MTFGVYKGRQLYLIHLAKNSEGRLQTPLFAPMRKETTWYPDILSCSTAPGYTSESLDIYSRDGVDVGKDIVFYLNSFKKQIRKRLSGY